MKRMFFLLAALIGFFTLSSALAEDDEVKYHDIHLTGDRICRRCTWRILDDYRIELINREGERGIYRRAEVLGVDKHPYWRKFLFHSHEKMGLPAHVIVPIDYLPMADLDNQPLR